MAETTDDVSSDLAAIRRIGAVPALLKVICEFTGMGFAAVARVTDQTWTACAVHDNIAFGLKPGDQLELRTTLCFEARERCEPISFDHASEDPVYREHHTPRLYGLESYISVPIVRRDGDYFGNLCAIDPKPAKVSDARTLTMFKLFAELIALQLESEDRQAATETALTSERATSELREQFIAVLGHDLRNPLAAVQASAEMLSRRTLEPETAKIAGRIRAASRRMSRLIDDVLDFARGRLGSEIGLTRVLETDLGTALGDVVTELRTSFPDRDLRDQIEIAQPVACDRGRMQQLLSNLVGNALAHGAADRPVQVRASIEGGNMLVISVANGGEPIPQAHLAKVFEPFWRPKNSLHAGGLGLGLYICSQIVKAHEGTLEVHSSNDGGTVFVARIPTRATG